MQKIQNVNKGFVPFRLLAGKSIEYSGVTQFMYVEYYDSNNEQLYRGGFFAVCRRFVAVLDSLIKAKFCRPLAQHFDANVLEWNEEMKRWYFFLCRCFVPLRK